MIFVAADFVVTVRHGEHGKLAAVRHRLDASPAVTMLGSYAVMHAIADHVVDHYLQVIDMIEVDIEVVESEIFSPRTNTTIESIYLLKREVVELRRSIGPFNAALGKVAMQQNVDMRKISAWVAIAAVPIAIAGIYGMNFDSMRELHAKWGYPAVLGLMLTVRLLLYRAFRRYDWL